MRVQAEDLERGDRVDLKGETWVVREVRAGVHGVELTIRHGGRSVTSTVRADRLFTVLGEHPADQPPTAPRSRPTEDGAGRPITWEDRPASELSAGGVPASTGPYAARPSAEQAVAAMLPGAHVAGDGILELPPVDDTTVLGHLILCHGIRYDGVKLADAKRAAVGEAVSVEEAFRRATLERAHALHERSHDQGDLLLPHRHDPR